jgi:hypothetical protein
MISTPAVAHPVGLFRACLTIIMGAAVHCTGDRDNSAEPTVGISFPRRGGHPRLTSSEGLAP